MVKILVIFLAAETLVFLLGFVCFFVVGASSGGIQEGLRMGSGVFYSWFAFAVLGFLVGAVCAAVTIFKHK